jgi:hypothetical protein
MKRTERKKLLLIAEELTKKDADGLFEIRVGVCNQYGIEIDLMKIKEAEMFCPYEYYSDAKLNYWWRSNTTDHYAGHQININARLIAIAFWLTMPKDMIQTVKLKNKSL